MSREPDVQTTRIGANEMRLLLTHFNVSLKRSPLRVAVENGAPEKAVSDTRNKKQSAQSLDRKGLLTQNWAAALTLLDDRKPAVTISTASLDTVEYQYFFPKLQSTETPDGILIGEQPDNEFRLDFPVGLPDLLTQLVEPLDPVGSKPPTLFEVKLSWAGLTVLAASVDYLRTLFAASLLQRRGLAGVFFRRSDIDAQILEGLEGSDNRSLVTLLKRLVPHRFPVHPDHMDGGIEELVSGGLLAQVQTVNDGWVPSAALLNLAFDLISPIPALCMSASNEVHSDGDNCLAFVVAIRGNSLWFLEKGSGNLPEHVVLRNSDGLALLTDIFVFLTNSCAGSEQHAILPQQQDPKPTQGKGLGTEQSGIAAKKSAARKQKALATAPDVAPGGDGKTPAKESKFCTQCGMAIMAGKKFCTGCGAPRPT